MQPQCVTAVNAYLAGKGKGELTEKDIAEIHAKFREGKMVLSRRDLAGWSRLSDDERTTEIGKWVMSQKMEKAAAQKRAKLNQQTTFVQMLQTAGDLANKMVDKDGKPLPGRHAQALITTINGLDSQMRGMQLATRSKVMNALEGTHTNLFTGRADKEFLRDLYRVMWGDKVQDPVATKTGEAIAGILKGQQEMLNRAGGNTGTIEHWTPQVHDADILFNHADEWKQFMLKGLDREQYRHLTDDYSLPTDAQMMGFIDHAHATITTDGNNKIRMEQSGVNEMPNIAEFRQPSQGGGGNFARKNDNKHRQIFFKDSATAIDYMEKFNNRGLGEALMMHLDNGAKDTAIVNTMGGSPDANMDRMLNTVHAMDAKEQTTHGYSPEQVAKGGTKMFMGPESYYRAMVQYRDAGNANVINHISRVFVQQASASMLGSTALRAPLQDSVRMVTSLMTDRNPELSKFNLMRKAVGGDAQLEAMLGLQYQELNNIMRGGLENALALGTHYTSASSAAGQAIDQTSRAMAAATQRLTLLEKWTNVPRRWGMLMHAAHLANWVGDDFAALEQGQLNKLARAGIDSRDWAMIQQLPVHNVNGIQVHNHDDIETHVTTTDANGMSRTLTEDEALNLRAKLAGFVRQGGDRFTNEYNFTSNTVMTGGGKTSVLNQQTMLFKRSASASTANLCQDIVDMGGLGTLKGEGLLMATLATSTMLGYIANSLTSVSQGKDLPPLSASAVPQALVTSGGLSMLGDFYNSFMSQMSGNQGTGKSAIAAVGMTMPFIKGLMLTAIGDKEVRGRGEALLMKSARDNFLPFTNYWYTKAAFNHLVFDRLANKVNPGYLQRMDNMARGGGTPYWWKPGQTAPQRAPQVGKYPKVQTILNYMGAKQ